MQLEKQALESAKQALIGHGDECTEVNDALALIDQALTEQRTTPENNGGKTGWPPGLLQDDCKGLSKWLSNRPDAKRRVREALTEQPAQRTWTQEHWTEYERSIAAAEREACAKVCDELDKDSQSQWPKRLATMIRARSRT